jgi:glycosyltransferase involved in cell wall biosynthesis|tara:strand:- start:1961 stop:2167 length:207 start_codon:yes stop_codon:yes gene_type:complete
LGYDTRSKTELAYQLGNPDALLKYMKKLLSNPDLATSCGAAARERAINQFDVSVLAKHWLNFYLTHAR